jgi:hypothetical protein
VLRPRVASLRHILLLGEVGGEPCLRHILPLLVVVATVPASDTTTSWASKSRCGPCLGHIPPPGRGRCCSNLRHILLLGDVGLVPASGTYFSWEK